MDDAQSLAALAAAGLSARTGVDRVDAVVVLGSGWDGAADSLGTVLAELPTTDLPGFIPLAAPGHRGLLRVCDLDGTTVLVYLGRTHLFEGHGPAAVAHPVRVAAAAGARVAVLTNASGSLRPDWTPGTAALIADHLNWTRVSPLTGAHFVDLTDAWSAALRATALGADLVGMSTVVEAIAARAAGLELLGLSAVTTLEDTGVELDPDDVVAVARTTAARLAPVVRTVVRHRLAPTAERTPS